MRDFLDLLIMGILIYLTAEFAIKYLYDKLHYILNKERFIEEGIMRAQNTIKAEDFFSIEKRLIRQGFSTHGVYILQNQTDGRYYVGQSVDLMRRIREHLKGRGNQGVYKSMQMGDRFTIQLIKLSESKFYDLDSLEKHFIRKHDSFRRGYNKTRGNG